MIKTHLPILLLVIVSTPFFIAQTTLPATQPQSQKPGEKSPSEDSLIWDFHPLGEINGTTNLYRSASPLRDSEKKSKDPAVPENLAAAKARLQHLYDRGIRTIISFEKSNAKTASNDKEDKAAWIDLEKTAAKSVGITYIAHPISNSGPGSIQTMSDAELLAWLDSVSTDLFAASKNGGVDFHCSAGHDRTGIVAAYLRIKFQHWPVEKAIQEMRDDGHNWPKFSTPGATSSWHESHLRSIALLLNQPTTAP